MVRIKEVERSVLEAFREEIPSIYYSDKTRKEYEAYRRNAEYLYRNLLKFPPEIFAGRTLIDFGAGTGENTVYLAAWGARCTLVEMNEKAQAISREVFRKYAGRGRHRFILSSIFDFDIDQTFEIVHCRGVLSHTDDKEGAFAKIASYLEPGGYLIYGDPNKAGGFQNMLQRYIIYRFARTWDEMVDLAERLFREDIDRAQRYGNRTRRCIIFDRWVVPKQNDPSVAEVLRWFDDAGLALYSSHPPVVFPVLSDSALHRPKFEPQSLEGIGALAEAVWLAKRDDDADEAPRLLAPLVDFARRQDALVEIMADCAPETRIDHRGLKRAMEGYLAAWDGLDLTARLARRMKDLLREAEGVMDAVEAGRLEEVARRVARSRHLFRGAVGVRHVDYIAHKKPA